MQIDCPRRLIAIAVIIGLISSLPGKADEQRTIDEACATFAEQLNAKTATIDLLDTPLDEATQLIAGHWNVPVRIDERALRNMGLKTDVLVAATLKDVAADVLLRLMLKPLQLTYRIDQFGIEITTPEEAESRLGAPCFYPVEDLIDHDENQFRFLGLRQTITTNLEMEAWEDLGGPGTIQLYENGLVISQTAPMHAAVENLLVALRDVQDQLDANIEDRRLPRLVESRPGTFDRIMRWIKKRKLNVTWNEVPLSEALQQLRMATELNFYLATEDLDDIGLTADTPVSGRWNQATLERILQEITQPLDLTWTIRGNVVVITTWEDAEASPLIRVYPVDDLINKSVVSPEDVLNPWHMDASWAAKGPQKDVPQERNMPASLEKAAYRKLMKMLTSGTEQESWVTLGGSGTCTAVPRAGCLVIGQTLPRHREIESLLSQIRAKRNQRPANPRDLELGERPSPRVVRSYHLPPQQEENLYPQRDLERLAQRIKTTIEPDSWDDHKAFIDVYENRIVVCQREDLHHRIEQLMQASGFYGQEYSGSVPVADAHPHHLYHPNPATNLVPTKPTD